MAEARRRFEERESRLGPGACNDEHFRTGQSPGDEDRFHRIERRLSDLERRVLELEKSRIWAAPPSDRRAVQVCSLWRRDPVRRVPGRHLARLAIHEARVAAMVG
jgi:hypothetical protein